MRKEKKEPERQKEKKKEKKGKLDRTEKAQHRSRGLQQQ